MIASGSRATVTGVGAQHPRRWLVGLSTTVGAGILAAIACLGPAPAPTRLPTPSTEPALDALDPSAPLVVHSVGTPVRASRTWASALAPNARGGWNFITQSFELYTDAPTEFVVVDLETGSASVHQGTPKRFTNAKFKVGSELRAANGRVFFPGVDNSVAYYDPADETVKELGTLLPYGDNKTFYQGVVGSDGKLYLGTQSSRLPTIVQLDPDTLKSRTLGEVGRDRQGYSYAYELAVDPPWVYVAVGQRPWELAALRIDTGEMRILATRDASGLIKLESGKDGVVATLVTNLRRPDENRERMYCVKGTLVPKRTNVVRRVRPARLRRAPVLPPLPDIDLSATNPDGNGIGRVRWRPRGSTAPFRETQFKVEHVTPVALESLFALPDGTVAGNAKQYHGFFRYDPRTDAFDFYGAHGPSGGPRVVMDGLVYIAGYPKAVLYAFDPRKPWTSSVAAETEALRGGPPPDVNPRRLGNFRESGAHYASFLAPSRKRLYFAGRRERDGIGTGVGFYDPVAKRFGGHHEKLEAIDPAGLAVAGDLVVLAGKARERGGSGVLVIYDHELHEIARVTPRSYMTSAGLLFATRDPGVVVGIVPEDRVLYRYDVRARKLLGWVAVEGKLASVAAERSDGSLWTIIDSTLVRIDPYELAVTPFGAMPSGVEHLAWQGRDLYMTVGADLWRARNVGVRAPEQPASR